MASSDLYSPDLSVVDNATEDGDVSPDGSPPSSATNCSLPTAPDWKEEYRIATATVCGMYLVFGLVCAFFGYRCFKAIMFFTGFIFASIVVYLICLEEAVLPVWSNALVALCAGILFGLITLLVQYVGLFMLGFHSGLLLAVVGLCVGDAVDAVPGPPSPWASVGILLLNGLVMALLNLCFQKSLTIFGSALYGGAILATTVDYFAENSVMLLWVWDRVSLQDSVEDCWVRWWSWAVLAVWPAALVLGMITQIALTGRGIYHESQFTSSHASAAGPDGSRRRGGGNGRSGNRKPETREERKQRKFRYLYQVRTCHGDVISQPIPRKYVQQVNETYSA